MTSLTIVIPFLPHRAEAAQAMHAALAGKAGVEAVLLPEGNGAPKRLADAAAGTRSDVVVVQEADSRYPLDGWEALVRPIAEQGADVVLARRSNASWPERALARFGQPMLAQALEDPFTGQRAFRRPVLESLEVQGHGATRPDFLRQFLTEALTLTGLGGLLGLALGRGFAAIVIALSPFPAAFQPQWVGAAFVSSLSVGLFFGLSPALTAPKLDPLDAARY